MATKKATTEGLALAFRTELEAALRQYGPEVAAMRRRSESPSYHGRNMIQRLRDLVDRSVTEGELVGATRDALSGSTDDDRARALLDALEAYQNQTAEMVATLTHHALVVLGRELEVAHG
jgi:hypothetical protein